MLFTYLIRKNVQGVLYAMFKYLKNSSNSSPLVVLTHIVLLYTKLMYIKKETYIKVKIGAFISCNYTASHFYFE